ncbi:MAG: hypothetical protein LKJ47_01715 [Bifidobacteriaceae bacterium]|jgi:hypothetical protein|nr:hypothetical protein [Bifidobacteriaceae bacterium]
MAARHEGHHALRVTGVSGFTHARKLLSLLLAAVLLVVFANVSQVTTPAASAASESSTSTKDLSQWITSVTFDVSSDGGSTWTTLQGNDQVNLNQKIRFKVHFDIPAGTLSSSQHTLTYQIPSSITTVTALSKQPISYEGQEMATYSVTAAGVVTLDFSQDYIDRASGLTPTGTFSFDVDPGDVNKGQGGKLDFTPSETVDVPVNLQSDLTITKTARKVGSDGTIDYTLTVKSVNGTADDVKLTDIMV